jgi:hypothetical protein
MWKTDHGQWPAASERHQLCPECDSLGPHDAVSSDPPWQAWLACIDCGTPLGRLTPLGLEPPGNPSSLTPTMGGRFAPRDEALRHERFEWTEPRVGDLDPVLHALLAAACGPFERPANER